MTLFLNQIFYNCNKFDNIQCIDNLQCFMLNIENLKKIQHINKEEILVKPLSPPLPLLQPPLPPPPLLQPPLPPLPPKPSSQSTPRLKSISQQSHPQQEVFFPQRENSLFWCMFISYYDKAEYDFIGKKYANRELEEKHKIMEYIKQNLIKIKESNRKITNIMIKEILSEVMVTKRSSLLELIALAFYYKKHVFIVNERTYIYYSYNKIEEPILENTVIIEYKSGNYGIDRNITQEKIDNIKNNLFCLENVEKPLKALSNYKTSDLEEISRKLELKLTSSFKKSELYNKIMEICIWKI